MKNPLEHFTTKDWLYAGGAVASIIALYFIFGRHAPEDIGAQGVTYGPGTLSDIPNVVLQQPTNTGTRYTNYNMGPITPVALNAPPEEQAAGSCGCNAPSVCGCAGSSQSQLDSGDAYSALGQYFDFLKSIDPDYNKQQNEQLAYLTQGNGYTSLMGNNT